MPKIRHGPRMMLIAFANHSTRIAIAASPAPRKTALMRKSITTVPLPPSMTRANVDPVRSTSSLAPMSASSCGPKRMPIVPKMAAAPSPMRTDWTALRAGAIRILLADAPRDRGRRADRESDRERVHHRHQRLGDPDGRDGVRSQAADEEHVGDHEDRLHHHLEHHRHCEKDDGTPDGRFREVLM